MRAVHMLGLAFSGVACVHGDGEMNKGGRKQNFDGISDADGKNQQLMDKIQCPAVKPFDFSAQLGEEAHKTIRLDPIAVVDPLLTSVGFVKMTHVFGLPVLGTEKVPDQNLIYATKLLAHFIDNDMDGQPDNPEALEVMKQPLTVFGFVADEEDSIQLWNTKFPSKEGIPFIEQFFCHWLFFEQWVVDQNLDFYPLLKKYYDMSGKDESKVHQALGKDSEGCQALAKSGFDWTQVHTTFAMVYFGIIETMTADEFSQLQDFYNQAKTKGITFNADNVIEDDSSQEMPLANFVAWANAARLNLTNCFCDLPELENWNLCSYQDIINFNPDFMNFLENLRGLPKTVLSPEYNSAAVTAAAQ